MNAQQLRNSILQQAIQGKLVPQDPTDEPASVLLQRIRKEKERLFKKGVLKKKEFFDRDIKEDETPFEIPRGWVWTKIDNVAFVTKLAGFEYTKYIADNLVTKDQGVPLFKGKNVQNGEIIYEFEAFIPLSISNELKRSQISKKCLLTPYVGTIGNIGIHNKNGIFHLGSNVGKIEFYNDNSINIIEEYVKYYLMSSFGYEELTKYKKATAQESISIEAIRDVFLPLPPLAEQRRIVAKIEELIPLVERYGKAQQALDQLNESLPARLRQSILQEAIQGRLVPQDPKEEPASELLKRIRKEKERLVKEGKLKKKDLESKPIEEEEIPFEIPVSWEWCHFGEIVNMQMGKTPPRGDAIYWENGTDSWVSISDMKDYGHIIKTKEKVSKYAAENAFRRKSPVGTLIMSFKLTVGRTSILDIPAYHNEAIISIFPYFDLNNSFRDYLFYLLPLLANLGDSKDAIKGKTLNSNSLFNLLIPLPPLSEQKRIVAKVEELFGVMKG